MSGTYWVYMVTNKTHTTLYIGVTNDLLRRIWEHRNKTKPTSFAAMYSTNQLVWYEDFPTAAEAITSEKRIKGITRAKKETMIRAFNPRWEDLSEDWYD